MDQTKCCFFVWFILYQGFPGQNLWRKLSSVDSGDAGAGDVNYIIDHAEIDVVFIQDKKIKETLSPNSKAANRLKALVAFTSATSEQ